jgi:hypothetical protein
MERHGVELQLGVGLAGTPPKLAVDEQGMS